MTDNVRIAILGTGKMGSAIATRLAAAGHSVVLWNRTRSRAEALGIGRVADTPAEAASDADLIISSLTGPEAVRAAYFGADGALAGGQGKHFVEMSTAGPDLVAELAARVADAGGTLVDAPIMGAPPAVRAGDATILVGGADGDVVFVAPVLGALGTVRPVGPLGNGARLKLVANSMLATLMEGAAELQVAGERAGLNREDVFWVLTRIVPALEARRAGLVEDRHSPPLFALRDLRKDVELAQTLFTRSDALTPLVGFASELVTVAAAATPELDISAVARSYRAVARSKPTGTDGSMRTPQAAVR